MRMYYPSARVSLAIVPVGGALEDRDLFQLTNVKPVACEVESNDLHTADTFSVTLEESVFPIDPRLIHTVAVAVFLGDAGALSGRLDTGEGNELILGVVDEIEKSFSRDDADTVELTGRDYSTFLIDTDWGHLQVELDGPITDVVEEVIATVPATSMMTVESTFDEVPEFPGGSPSQTRYIARQGASVWEGLSELAARVGAIITVRGDQVIVRPPRTADVDESMPLFVHGRNLESLRVRREYGKHTTPNVVVRARHPDTYETIVGRYPDEAEVSTKAARSGGVAATADAEEETSFTISHPDPTEEALSEIARQVWESHERQQLQVEFTTREMRVWEVPRSFIDENRIDVQEQSFDVTRLKNGQSVRVHVDPVTRNVLRRAVTEEQKKRYLVQEGFTESVARELARGFRRIDTPMFVRTAKHRLAEGGEYTLDVECENRITVDI